MDKAVIQAISAELAQRSGPGIVFVTHRCDAVSVAEELTQALNVPVEWVTAVRPLAERKELAERLRCGTLKWAVATSTWATGLDIPALNVVVLTGNVSAPIGVLQSVGRGLRVQPDKCCEIINIVEPNSPHGQRRAAQLTAAGFETEEGFLDELVASSASAPASAVNLRGFWWRELLEPWWVWPILVGVSLLFSMFTGS